MENLMVKGFRSIKDSGNIELKPITVLIGKNSCGKSSFIRLFPLLKQSVERQISDPLLWYGDYVDFGDYEHIKPFKHKDEKTELQFTIKLNKNINYRFLSRAMSSDFIDVTVNLTIKEKYFSSMKISYEDQVIEVIFNEDRSIDDIYINNKWYDFEKINYTWKNENRGILPSVESHVQESKIFFRFYNFGNDEVENKLYDVIRDILEYEDSINSDKINELIEEIVSFDSKKEILKKLQSYSEINGIKKYFENADINNSTFATINSHIVMNNLSRLIYETNEVMWKEFNNLHYLKPIRANVDRYYRVQGVNIDQVDSDGSNIPMILYNLIANNKLKKFENWCYKNFGIKFSLAKSSGHVSLIIKGDDGETNVADSGYGYSQILPIIVELWLLSENQSNDDNYKEFCHTIVIEQPELHLHPAFQKDVINLFSSIVNEAKKNNITIKIIFETHSETMINQLGYLINKGELNSNDVNILAFEKNDDTTTVKSLNYNERGLIEKWPLGFFSAL